MTGDIVKVLLVDDLVENRVALAALLRNPDVELLQASSGPEALELLLAHDVALALLDVQMPDMDGFELAELMRGTARTRHIPIIFVTAGARDAQRQFQGYESGAVDFLFKPIEPHMLRSKVDVFLELYRQRRRLADILRMNEMFIGILGHDLRNPLSTMLMGAQQLEMHTVEEPKLRTLRRMIGAGQRMTEMIDQILDLTRARLAGGAVFAREKTDVDIAELVRRAIGELETTARGREIRFVAQGDCATAGDPHRLLQLFSNLIENALTHSAPGASVAVAVTGGERDVTISVRNRGTIADDSLPILFDPFAQGAEKATRKSGLGLGLYISQQIVAAHAGHIDASNDQSTGEAVFVARLPRSAADSR